MKTYLKNISKNSLIKSALKRTDYSDNFAITIPSENAIPIEKIPILFFQSMPKWFTGLMYIREGIAKLIGLKTAIGQDVQKQLDNFKGEVGESIALFHVMGRSESEIMTGENDSHLDFRLSFFAENDEDTTELALATTVQFNSWLGKLYFLPVKPIHRLIVPIMLKRIAKKLIVK